jgi:general secretion pathway protein H
MPQDNKSRFLIIFKSINGFTLLEMLIVMLIIGLAFGFTVILTTYKGSTIELNTFTKEVSATLRYARSHAVAEKRVYSFVLWEDERAFGLYADFPKEDTDIEPSPIVYKDIPESLEMSLKDGSDKMRIDFYPQGNSSGGIIEIRNQKGRVFSIIVNKVTGRVRVSKI